MTVTPSPDHPAPWPDATRAAWRAAVEHDLKGAPFEKRLVSKTYEGLEIQPLYTREEWDNTDDSSGIPGVPPFVRGATTLGGAMGGWCIHEERAETDPHTLNIAILDDLTHGTDAIDIRLGDAHNRGAAILSVDDLDRALEGVHLGMVTVGFVPGSSYAETAALARALWDRRGEDPSAARIAFNADPIAELARTGTLPAPVGTMLRRLGSLAKWTDAALPNATAVRVSSAPSHDANATAAQDLACAITTGIAYMRAMEAAGLPPVRAARQIVFQFSLSTNIFLAIAKIRTARRLWDAVLGACGVGSSGRVMRIETRTARRSLTHRDPWVNMLRNTAACFAGAVAGADSILSAPFDDPLGLPDPLARRIARNTQTILAHESSLQRVIDPAGGSYYLERLTDDLAQAAWDTIRRIEHAGGMPAALQGGPLRGWIADAYAERLRNIAKRKDAVTGVSEFPMVHEHRPVREPVDTARVYRDALERLASRPSDPERDRALEELERARSEAIGMDQSGMDQIVRASAAGASIPELGEAINRGLTPETSVPLAPHPYAEPFEAMRDASDSFEAQRGHRPAIALIAVGPPAEHTARVNFTTGFFEAGGFEVHTSPVVQDTQAAADAFAALHAEHRVDIAAICAADPRYAEVVPDLAPRRHDAGARTVVLAGRPGEDEQIFRDAGVDRFVFLGCDVVKTLNELMHEEGALS